MITEVQSRPIEIEEKIDIAPIKKKSTAKTFRDMLLGKIQVASHDNNHELRYLFEELLRDFDKFYPKKIVRNQVKILSGWKGEGNTSIYKGFADNFIISYYVAGKEGEEGREVVREVLKEDLNKMIWIIKNLPLNEPVSCYYISEKLGYPKWEDLWKVRKVYFDRYYFPVKICEALLIINYSGRGKITRIL